MIAMLLMILAPQAGAVGAQLPPEASPGGFAAPAYALDASFNYRCPGRNVEFSMTQEGGAARITRLQIGEGSTDDAVERINALLSDMNFERAAVTCTGLQSTTIIFTGWRDTGGEEYDDVHITVQSPSSSSPRLAIQPSWLAE